MGQGLNVIDSIKFVHDLALAPALFRHPALVIGFRISVLNQYGK